MCYILQDGSDSVLDRSDDADGEWSDGTDVDDMNNCGSGSGKLSFGIVDTHYNSCSNMFVLA